MRVQVNVTKNDIKNGIPHDAENCAVALRVKKMIKKEYRDMVSVVNPIEIDSYFSCTNKKMEKFIQDFDTLPQNEVKPVSFVVDLPMKYLTNKTINDNRIRN